MHDKNLSRRDALKTTFFLSIAASGAIVAACKKEEKGLSCTDTSGLAPADAEMRVTLAYVDQTTDVSKRCDNCLLYKAAPAPKQCGGCNVVKGPINPSGYCKSWAAKPA